MSVPMVRAYLAGQKTQTRLVIKPQPEHLQVHYYKGETIHDAEHRMWCWKDLVMENLVDFPDNDDRRLLASRSPHGVAGDRLWVRETWSRAWELDENDEPAGQENTYYRADGEPFSQYLDPDTDEWRDGLKWKPSIHMPRAASRITLDITGVRVERLQDITKTDAIAEGIQEVEPDAGHRMWRLYDACNWSTALPRESYQSLWETINGHGSWEANPWVWVIEFPKFLPDQG